MVMKPYSSPCVLLRVVSKLEKKWLGTWFSKSMLDFECFMSVIDLVYEDADINFELLDILCDVERRLPSRGRESTFYT
jgi:hypothetical protein